MCGHSMHFRHYIVITKMRKESRQFPVPDALISVLNGRSEVFIHCGRPIESWSTFDNTFIAWSSMCVEEFWQMFHWYKG